MTRIHMTALILPLYLLYYVFIILRTLLFFFFFFFNDTATTEIYTLSLHDALPIWGPGLLHAVDALWHAGAQRAAHAGRERLAARRPAGRSPVRRRAALTHRGLARGPSRVDLRCAADMAQRA